MAISIVCRALAIGPPAFTKDLSRGTVNERIWEQTTGSEMLDPIAELSDGLPIARELFCGNHLFLFTYL